jgi:hypothetical protein
MILVLVDMRGVRGVINVRTFFSNQPAIMRIWTASAHGIQWGSKYMNKDDRRPLVFPNSQSQQPGVRDAPPIVEGDTCHTLG